MFFMDVSLMLKSVFAILADLVDMRKGEANLASKDFNFRKMLRLLTVGAGILTLHTLAIGYYDAKTLLDSIDPKAVEAAKQKLSKKDSSKSSDSPATE